MKTPPLLLGATLVFWGWQTGYLPAGLTIAVALEASRSIKARWEFSDEDFTRIWTFCTLVFLAAAVYAFTSNQGPSGFRNFFDNPNFFTQRNASAATARTAASLVRWLPMVFCLFIAAQAYSSRGGVPLETISLILRWRWKRARRLGQPPPPSRVVDLSYPYFALCLFAASVHSAEDYTFFWGLCALLAWGLWPYRARRFSPVVWAMLLGTGIGLGFFGQSAVGHLQAYLGNLNPQWMAGFGKRRFDPAQSRTEIGNLGRLKSSNRIVVRVDARNGAPPPLLREASYQTYKVQTWYSVPSEKDFFAIHETNNTTWVLVPDKPGPRTVTIACYLDGGKALLPLPEGCSQLDNLTAYLLSKNSLGAVLAEGPDLVVFDADYGPGPTLDSPPDQDDTGVPQREWPALDQVIAELHLREQTMEQAVRTLNTYFLSRFTYSTWQRPSRHMGPNETPLSRFLLNTRSGHCEYFATAGVLLLRRAGFPARYAVGYAVHEGSGGKFVVRQRDAHAWCLVWDKKSGIWQDFDGTPATWIEAEARRGPGFQWLQDLWSRIGFEFSKLRWGQSHWRQYLLWGLIPTLALLLYRIIFQSRHRFRDRSADAEGPTVWPGLDSEFYQLELKLAGRGLARQRSEPLSEWFQRAADEPSLADLRNPLQRLLQLHYRYRFDPHGLTPKERTELRRQAKECLAKIDQPPVAVDVRRP
jgi:transglutaminase-like putative cysteine protease